MQLHILQLYIVISYIGICALLFKFSSPKIKTIFYINNKLFVFFYTNLESHYWWVFW